MPGWFDSATLSAGASHVLPILLDAAVKSLIVLVPAVVATAVMRRSSAAARHLVWFLAVAGLLVLPILSATLPGWQILPRWIDLSADAAPDVAAFQPLESESPAPVTIGWSNEPAGSRDSFEPTTAPPATIGEVEATPDQLTTDRQEAAAIAPEPEEPRPSDGPQRSRARVLLACVPLVWAAGTLLVLGWLCLGAAIMRRLGRRCEPIVDGPWAALLGRLSAELKLDRSVRLLRSDHRSMPMAWGLFRPKLLLPAEASSWPADRCRVVLLHELAHIKRHDPLTQFITQIACAVYWFNPLVWVAARRMVTERERACDDLVLAAGSPACDYADHVLQIASSLRTGRLVGAAAIAMARPSSLEGRLLAILDNKRSRRALTRTAVVLLVVAFAAIILPIGMMRAMGSDQKPTSAGPSGANSQADDHTDLATRPAAATAPAVPAGKAGLRIQYAIPGDEEEAEFGWDDGWMTRVRFSGVFNEPSVRIRNGGEVVVDHLTPGSYRVFRIKRQRTAGRSAVVAHCDERMVELKEGTITLVEYVWNGWPIEGELVGATQEEMGSAKMYVQSLDPKWPRLLDAFECPPDGKWKTAPVPPGQYRVFVHVTRGLKFRIHYRAPDLGEFIGDAKITVTKEARPGPVRIVRLVKPPSGVPGTTSPGLSTLKIRFEIPQAGDANEFVVEPFDVPGICKPGVMSDAQPPPGVELERIVTIRNGGEAIVHNLLPGRWRIMRWKEVPGLPMGSVGCEDSVVEVEADKTTTADFVRRECWPLEGELADATPDEIAHAFVTVQSVLPGGSGSTVVYDAVKCAPDGTWKTLPIPPGEYWVVAQLIPSPVGAKAPGQAKIMVSQGVRPPRVRLSKDSVRRPSASTRPEGASQSSTTAMRTAAGADEAAFGSQVTGVVVDEVGKPVGGAVVGFMRGWAADKTVTTGEEGAFVLACGRTSLRYEDVLAVADGGERQGVYQFSWNALDPAARRPIRIVLKPSRRVSVRVVDHSGKPVSDAQIGVTGGFVEAAIHTGKTDADGAFLLRVPADLKVEWVIGFKAGVGFDYFENHPFWPPRGSKPRLLPEQVKLVLDGARQVHIRAVDSDGRPLPKVGFVPWTIRKPGKMADVNLSGSRLAAQSTDAQGIASFDWLPVNVTQDVAFLCHDREDLHMPEYPRLRPGSSETELTARLLRNARVAGKVLLPDGTPARDVLIQAEGRGATNHPCGKSVRTAADGSYRATVCPDQSHIIAIIDDTWAAPSHTGVILREDQVRDGLDFQLAKGTLIRGTITATSDERPLAGETVSLRQIGPELPEGFRSGPAPREGGLLRWVKSDATGRYVIRVGPGTYEIRGPDQEGKWQRLVIAAEEEIVRHFAFDKPERKPLAGLVVDGTNDEKPVSGAIIFAAPTHEAKSHRPREFRATTDGQGRFKVLRDVGPMVLYARDAEGLLAGWVRVSDSQDEVSVPLASAARATGRVVDETGKPLAGQEVVRQLIIGIEGAQGSILNFTQLDSDGNTDANGAFTIPGLPDEAICRIHLLDTARRSFERVYGFYVRGSGRIAIPDLVVGPDGPVPTTRPAGGGSDGTTRPAVAPDGPTSSSRAKPWISLLPARMAVQSLKELELQAYAYLAEDSDPAVKTGDWEIRTADQTRRLAVLPVDWPSSPARGASTRPAGARPQMRRVRLGLEALRRAGDFKPGEYFLAWVVAGQRVSNVVSFRVGPNDDTKGRPLLEIEAVEAPPGQTLPLLGIRARRDREADPAPKLSDVAFPELTIDGQPRRWKTMAWAGPDRPLKVGEQATYLKDSANNLDPPVEPGRSHDVAATVGSLRSTTIRLAVDDKNEVAWDQATAKLGPVPQPEVLLRGRVIGPDGSPGAGYEVYVEAEAMRGRLGELPHVGTDDQGRYVFRNLPPGKCEVWTHPSGMGQPSLRVKEVVLALGKTRELDLDLTTRFRIGGKVVDQAGKPVSGREVMSTWKSTDGQQEFEQSGTTDAQGKYQIGSPLPIASYVGLSGTGEQPKPYHDVQAPTDRLDFVVK